MAPNEFRAEYPVKALLLAPARPAFAFVLVNAAPQAAQAYDAIWRYTVPYMRFRHPDAKTRHWVLCVQDALGILDAAVAPGASAIGEIHVYAHANEFGSVWGRLHSGQETYRALTQDEVAKFRRTSAKAKALAAKADGKTRLYFHGCNLGRSPDALLTWCSVFGVTRGLACAPDMFQHFCSGPLHFGAICPGANLPYLERDVFGMADLERYIADVIARGPGQCGKLRADFAESFRQTTMSRLDAYLHRMFLRLRLGNQLPWPDAGTISRADAIARMRVAFELARGVPLTFLARELQFGLQLGNACTESALNAPAEAARIFPWHTAQWQSHHRWVPHAPGYGP